jgi:hypothetical protein
MEPITTDYHMFISLLASRSERSWGESRDLFDLCLSVSSFYSDCYKEQNQATQSPGLFFHLALLVKPRKPGICLNNQAIHMHCNLPQQGQGLSVCRLDGNQMQSQPHLGTLEAEDISIIVKCFCRYYSIVSRYYRAYFCQKKSTRTF